jgi:hypothetical protein
VGGFYDRQPVAVAAFYRLVRLDKHLTHTIGVVVDRFLKFGEACDAGDAGDDGGRQGILLHHNTPNHPQGFFC